MKFRGMMNDTSPMRDFMNVANSLSKLAKELVMRITERKLFFIISIEESGPKTPLVWCELPAFYYFHEYNVTGISDEHNEIYLEFSTDMFARTLQILKQPTKFLKMKLTHKQTPCLTLEIEQIIGDSTQNTQLVYDIPVDVIDLKYWTNYAEPKFDDFHVSIDLPPLKIIRNIVDKMKHMSHNLIVTANQLGNLTLKIESNMVVLATHFHDLNIRSFAVAESQVSNEDSEQPGSYDVTASVDIKKFLMFLTGMQMTNCRATCNIIQDKMVKVFIEQPGVLSFQIFLTELLI